MGLYVYVLLGLLGFVWSLRYPPPPAGEVRTVTVELFEWGIALDPTPLPAGPIRFRVINRGSIGHAFALALVGSERATRVFGPGQTEMVDADLLPGRYAIWCPVPGHRERGMEAELRVLAVPPSAGKRVLRLKRFDRNGNDLLDDPEFFAIIDAWVARELDDATFFLAIDLWVGRRPISSVAGM